MIIDYKYNVFAGCYAEWDTEHVQNVKNSQGCNDYCFFKYKPVEGYKGYCENDNAGFGKCICKPVGE